jgi:hypothetical protein
MKSIFKSKIKCIHCGGNFKRKIEREKVKYCCTNYNVGKCDKRVILEESFLIGLLEKRFQRELTHEEIMKLVDRIIVEEKLLFEIELTDGSQSILFGRNLVRY